MLATRVDLDLPNVVYETREIFKFTPSTTLNTRHHPPTSSQTRRAREGCVRTGLERASRWRRVAQAVRCVSLRRPGRRPSHPISIASAKRAMKPFRHRHRLPPPPPPRRRASRRIPVQARHRATRMAARPRGGSSQLRRRQAPVSHQRGGRYDAAANQRRRHPAAADTTPFKLRCCCCCCWRPPSRRR